MRRSLIFAVLGLVAATLCSAAPAATQRERNLLWTEAQQTFDGLSYTYAIYTWDSQATAEGCYARLRNCVPMPGSDNVLREQRFNEVPLPLRATLGRLEPGQVSAPLAWPDAGHWSLIYLHATSVASFPGSSDAATWLQQHAASALPTLTQLRNDGMMQLRRTLSGVRTSSKLQQVLARGRLSRKDLDTILQNGNTALINAIGTGNRPLAAALLRHGASANRCGLLRCPLSSAVQRGDIALARLLLAHGAAANGTPPYAAPLLAAAARADRAMTTLLLEAGADPLRARHSNTVWTDQPASLLHGVPADQPEYLSWLQQQMEAAMSRQGIYEWQAWIEQYATRTPLIDGATIVLQAAPFRLVLRLNDAFSLRVAASQDPQFHQHNRRSQYRRTLLQPRFVGPAALDSSYLGLAAVGASADEWSGAVTNDLTAASDPNRSRGTVRVMNEGRPELIYTVKEWLTPGGPVSTADYAGPDIQMILGLLPPLLGADFYRPARVTLHIAR